jgi:hypothetical protein
MQRARQQHQQQHWQQQQRGQGQGLTRALPPVSSLPAMPLPSAASSELRKSRGLDAMTAIASADEVLLQAAQSGWTTAVKVENLNASGGSALLLDWGPALLCPALPLNE